MKDFFISYTGADVAWADWMATVLAGAGFDTVHQAKDFRGQNFVSDMKNALEARWTIAVCSTEYFKSVHCEREWTAAFNAGKLILVKVRDCGVPTLLGTAPYINLAGLEVPAVLLDELKRRGIEPAARPTSAAARTFDVPMPRNPNFTGRDGMLRDLHSSLQSGGAAALTAISGLGGVGKTQLALEYAYRYASEYERVFWLRAEEPATLASEYAGIAARLNLPEKDLANQSEIVAAVREWLAHNSGWLLVLDNATGPEACAGYIPRPNTGHILITSRHTAWRGVAQPMEVVKLSREESVAFLKKRSGRDEPAAAGELSEALGDLPLALEHAAAYVDSAGISIREYVGLLPKYLKELLEPVASTWRISFEKLRTEEPGALELLNLIAWLAPDDIPRDLLQGAAENPLAFNHRVEVLLRYSLIRSGDGVIGVHRLVQEVTRNALEEAEQTRWVEVAVKLVNNAFPFESDDYRNWPACARLLAHALQVAEHGEQFSAGLAAVGRLLNQAGLYERQRAQLQGAGRLYTRALEIYEKVHGPEHPQVAIIANNIGTILKAQGDLPGALVSTRRALEIEEKARGRDHPQVAIYASNIGAILKERGDLAGALEYTRRALAIDEKVYGPDHPSVAIRANNIGQILQEQGDLAGALESTQRALEIWDKVYGPGHPHVALCVNNIGLILKEQGDLAGALEYTRRALQIDENVFGPDHPDVAIDAGNIGLVLRAQGDLPGALQYIRRALRILTDTYGPDHPNTKIAAENLRMIEEAIAGR